MVEAGGQFRQLALPNLRFINCRPRIGQNKTNFGHGEHTDLLLSLPAKLYRIQLSTEHWHHVEMTSGCEILKSAGRCLTNGYFGSTMSILGFWSLQRDLEPIPGKQESTLCPSKQQA